MTARRHSADLQFQRLTRLMAEETVDRFPTVFADFRFNPETGVTCTHSKVQEPS